MLNSIRDVLQETVEADQDKEIARASNQDSSNSSQRGPTGMSYYPPPPHSRTGIQAGNEAQLRGGSKEGWTRSEGWCRCRVTM